MIVLDFLIPQRKRKKPGLVKTICKCLPKGHVEYEKKINLQIHFSLFCIALYHKLRIILSGLYNMDAYDIPDL